MAKKPPPPRPLGLGLTASALPAATSPHEARAFAALRGIVAAAGGELANAWVLAEREIPTAADSPPYLRVLGPPRMKPVSGWWVVRLRADARVYEVAHPDPDRDPFAVWLQASAAVTVDLVVW